VTQKAKKESTMMRYLGLIGFLVASLSPSLASCAEAKRPETTIVLAQPAQSPTLAAKHWLEVPYGETDTEIGFQAGGNEQQPLGPTWFEVDNSGGILVADPVHRKLFHIARGNSGAPVLKVSRPLGPRESLPPQGNHPGTAIEVIKTGAESGEVVFGEQGNARHVGIEIGGPLATLRLVGVTERGDAVVVLEKFRELGKLAVDREIIAINPEGKILTRYPLDDQLVAAPPEIEFFVAPDGYLYRMIPGKESVVFTRRELP
jgi:hypothetical protein